MGLEDAHIRIDDRGIARIAGTRMKVIHIVMDKLAYDWTPEEIHAQHPHLNLAEIRAALAYYHDRRPELDAQIDRDLQAANDAAAAAADSPVLQKLRKLGKLP